MSSLFTPENEIHLIIDHYLFLTVCKCWVSSTPETPEIVPMTYLIGCELLSSTFAMPDNLILLVICTEQEVSVSAQVNVHDLITWFSCLVFFIGCELPDHKCNCT